MSAKTEGITEMKPERGSIWIKTSKNTISKLPFDLLQKLCKTHSRQQDYREHPVITV